METLHFISLNNCFVSIHVVVRFTHAYRDIVADNDYAIFSSPEPKAQGELIVWDSSRRP